MNALQDFLGGTTLMTLPKHQQLSKHLLSQVLVRFDFPPVLRLAEASEGQLVTSRKNALVEKLVDLISTHLPAYEYRQTVPNHFVFEVNNDTAIARKETQDIVHTFISPDKSDFFEISFSFFVFVVNGPKYSGFDTYLNTFWPIWEKLFKELNIKRISRVGIRKINNLVKMGPPNEINFNDEIVTELLPPIRILNCSMSEFTGVILGETQDQDPKSRVQYGVRSGDLSGLPATQFFLDFDVYSSESRSPDSSLRSFLKEKINVKHWELFCRAITRSQLVKLGLKDE